MSFIAKWNKFVVNESEKPKGKYVKRLTVFDFDGTLFRSPEKPEGFKGNWWASKESLAEPHVPESPDRSYWFKDTIAAAEEAFDNSKTYSVMMTGRMQRNFEKRILDLLEQNGINFNEVHMNDSGQDTEKFKLQEIKKILKKYPTISLVEIWDDKADHLKYFKKELETDNLKVKINKVDNVIDEARKRSLYKY
jgi:hypothetical protein